MLARLETIMDSGDHCARTLPREGNGQKLVHDYILAITLGHKAVKDQRRLNYDFGHRPTGLSCNDSEVTVNAGPMRLLYHITGMRT